MPFSKVLVQYRARLARISAKTQSNTQDSFDKASAIEFYTNAIDAIEKLSNQ